MSLKSFTEAYVVCALWSSNDQTDESGGEPLDANYDADDIAPATMAEMRADCAAFYEANSALWANEPSYRHDEHDSDDMAGHDFWLTRNGHGAGFWDRGLKNGEALSEAARVYGGVDLYVGDDGKIYS